MPLDPRSHGQRALTGAGTLALDRGRADRGQAANRCDRPWRCPPLSPCPERVAVCRRRRAGGLEAEPRSCGTCLCDARDGIPARIESSRWPSRPAGPGAISRAFQTRERTCPGSVGELQLAGWESRDLDGAGCMAVVPRGVAGPTVTRAGPNAPARVGAAVPFLPHEDAAAASREGGGPDEERVVCLVDLTFAVRCQGDSPGWARIRCGSRRARTCRRAQGGHGSGSKLALRLAAVPWRVMARRRKLSPELGRTAASCGRERGPGDQ